MPAASDLDQLIATWSPRLRKAFLDAIYAIRDAAQIAVIGRMLENHDVDGALRAVRIDPLMFRDFDRSFADAFEAAGRLTSDGLPALKEPSGHQLRVMFDARNPRAEAWLRTYSSDLVTQIVDDQRQAVRQHLEAGMAAGQNPRDVALELVGRVNSATGKREGGVIGLTASQEAWARNYAAELEKGDAAALTRALRDKRFDKTVTKAIAAGQPIPADLRAKMVAAYRNRALRYRGETIGRTEAMTSLHQAQNEAVTQAVDKGQVKASAVRRIWRSAGDDRVRDTHRVLNGESVGLHDVFQSPSGARLRFPGDPQAPAAETINCRCTLSIRVDHLANVA